jgi:hypothetical protein
MAHKFDDKELQLLQESRTAAAQLDADAKRYVGDSAYRKTIDELDKKMGTNLGAKLKRHFYGEQEQEPLAPQPTEHEVATAVKRYSRQRCNELYNHEPDQPRVTGPKLDELKQEERDEAKIAARFYGLLPSDGSDAQVAFNYETPQQRQAKREEKQRAAERLASGLLPGELAPGVVKCSDGIGYMIADQKRYDAWRESQSDAAILAAAAKEQG